MAMTPDPVNCFSSAASVEEFQTWFDADGRLVKESLMRQCLFEGKFVCLRMCIHHCGEGYWCYDIIHMCVIGF